MPIQPPFSPLPTPYPGTFTLANVGSATLDLNNFNVAIGSLQGGGFAGGNITLGLGNGSFGSGGTLQVIQSINTIYAGVISGNGNVIFGSSAGGTIFLVGHSTYNGNTYADIVTLGNNSASPANTNVIFQNTSSDGYALNGFNQQVGSVSGGGPLGGNLTNSQSGGGVWTVAATTAQLVGQLQQFDVVRGHFEQRQPGVRRRRQRSGAIADFGGREQHDGRGEGRQPNQRGQRREQRRHECGDRHGHEHVWRRPGGQ